MAGTKYLKGECQHCGGHLEFPAEHAGLQADCPHCGQNTELMLPRPPEESAVPRKAIIWAVVALMILGAGLGASLVALRMAQRRVERLRPKVAAGTNAVASAAEAAGPFADQGFSVSAISIDKAPGTSLIYANGTLTNLAIRQRFGVKLELELADATGRKVGTATDYQAVIEPGGEWRFRALVIEAKAKSARLTGITEK